MAKNSQVLLDLGQGFSIMIGLPKIPSWNSKERPSNAKPGTFGFNSQSKQLEYWDGTSWWTVSMDES